MEEIFRVWAGYVALGLEVIAVALIGYGGAAALAGLLRAGWRSDRSFNSKKKVWLGFGIWLLLGLEFEMAADIVRSAISPTWEQLGQLGAVAAIRTFLNYFLERDVEKYSDGPT